MSELRQNLATREWVVIASERAQRPSDFFADATSYTHDGPEEDAACPFCPGREGMSVEVERVESPDGAGWDARVVENRFAALRPEGDATRVLSGVERRIEGRGFHEVLIENRRHNGAPALVSVDDVARTFKMFRTRGRTYAQDPAVQHVIFFKNHKERAGSSLTHPHAQLVGLPVVPAEVRTRAERARRHYDDTGRCVFCQMIALELRAAERVIAETDRFVAFVPYAAYSPFHIWVIGKQHRASFLEATDDELDDFASLVRDVLRRIYGGLGDPAFNYVVRSGPLRDLGAASFHWYLAIVPRVSTTAGFEMGTGMFINPSLPEESAAFLRGVDVGAVPTLGAEEEASGLADDEDATVEIDQV